MIKENLLAVRQTLKNNVKLVAVSKYQPLEYLVEAYEAGQRVFGESHALEVRDKAEALPKDIEWHFIGHLQTNKVKFVVGKVDLIQSVDSLRLLEAIQKQAEKIGCTQDILLEVNVALQESKSGFTLVELPSVLEKVGAFSNIRVRGFMTIPPIAENPTGNHKFFQEMCNLSVDITAKKYDNVWVNVLSMGMSDDYADAIACGSTMIRVGTAIFGARNYT